MVGHIGAYRLKGFSSGPAVGGEVRRLVKTVGALQPHIPQAAQVAYCPARRQWQRQEGGIGGNDQFPVQAPLEAQPLDAVGLVLIVQPSVEGVEG